MAKKIVRAQDLDLGPPGPIPSPWTLARPFILQSTDLPEVQINNIQPEPGQPKVLFSWCICTILDFHNRWGTMGPNETAITIPRGPRIISVFDVHGCHRVQIKHFFGMQIGSRTPSGLDPLLVRRLHRTRGCAGHAIAL